MIGGNWRIRPGEYEREGRAKTIPWQGRLLSFGSGLQLVFFFIGYDEDEDDEEDDDEDEDEDEDEYEREGRAKTIPWQGKLSSFGSGSTSTEFICTFFTQIQ